MSGHWHGLMENPERVTTIPGVYRSKREAANATDGYVTNSSHPLEQAISPHRVTGRCYICTG